MEELKDKVFALQVFLEMQQDEIAALKAAHEQQEQEREVYVPHPLASLPCTHSAPSLPSAGDLGATTRASSARGDATDAWVANGVRHAASGRDHATPPRIEQVALGRAHQGAPELTA